MQHHLQISVKNIIITERERDRETERERQRESSTYFSQAGFKVNNLISNDSIIIITTSRTQ